MSGDMLRTFAATLGILLSVPVIVVLVKASFFFGEMSRSVNAFAERVEKLDESLRETLKDHDTRLRHLERDRDVRDGRDRRDDEDRRTGPGRRAGDQVLDA